MALSSKDIRAAIKAKNILGKDLSRSITVEAFCELSGINEKKAQQFFKNEYESTVAEYFTYLKMQFAREQLINTESSLEEISESIGYYVPNFIKAFKKHFDITPGQFRKHYNNEKQVK